jgi:hypothetical protein
MPGGHTAPSAADSALGPILRTFPAPASGEVHRETLEIGERAVVEGAFVRGPQDHAGRLARLECFLPTRCTQAPTVAGPQAGKAEFRHWCRQIIAAGLGKLEKRGSHDGADGVTPNVLSASVTAAVSKEPRHRCQGADFEPVAEDIPGCSRPTAATSAVISQHCRLPCRCHTHEGRPTVAGKLCAINFMLGRSVPRTCIFSISQLTGPPTSALAADSGDTPKVGRLGGKIWQALPEARKDGLSLKTELAHGTRGSLVNYRQACGQRHFLDSIRSEQACERLMISQRRKVGLA